MATVRRPRISRLLPDPKPHTTGGPSDSVQHHLARLGSQQLRMPRAFDRLAAPPLFITGFGRSGTTLTLDVFRQHPEVHAILETWLLRAAQGVTGVFTQPQWIPAFYEDQLAKIGSPHAATQLISYEDMACELGELVASWLVRGMSPEHRYLVEKGPIDVPALAAMFPEALLVHVIRDGRDVAFSARTAARTWAPEMGTHRGLADFALLWKERVEAIRNDATLLGERYLEVRYEELRTDIADSTRKLFDFAGIEYDDTLLEQIRRATSLDSYPEGQRASGFRGSGRTQAWRERFGRREARAFDRAAGSLLVELGYEDDPHWWHRSRSKLRR